MSLCVAITFVRTFIILHFFLTRDVYVAQQRAALLSCQLITSVAHHFPPEKSELHVGVLGVSR